MEESHVLGLDIGTTSIKAAIIESKSHRPVAVHSLPSKASLPHGTDGEQDVLQILASIDACIHALPHSDLKRVTRIGICGQMHGVCLWSGSPVHAGAEFSFTSATGGPGLTISSLYTWMDSRCDPAFLASLPTPDSHLKLATGHGCATLFWLQRNAKEMLESYERAGTIMDLVVALLCGNAHEATLIGAQNAASWGYFNTERGEWNHELLQKAGFPVRLLPTVTKSTAAGKLQASWHGIPAGVPVGIAMGDLQCSVLSTALQSDEVFLNMSTSAQIGHIWSTGAVAAVDSHRPGIEYFPYFNGAQFAVGASLNGGNVLDAFVRMLKEWCITLTQQDVNQDVIWSRILSAAAEVPSSDLSVVPTLFGERHAPGALASVTCINSSNTRLGQVTRAVCAGLVRNLTTLMPVEYLRQAGIQSVVVTGSTFTRNPILSQECDRVFEEAGFKLRKVAEADAAMGAAIAAALGLA